MSYLILLSALIIIGAGSHIVIDSSLDDVSGKVIGSLMIAAGISSFFV